MELFERDEALEALTRSRAESFAGRGCVTLVNGPVAVGKSALLDAFIRETAQAGGLALTAVASHSESSLPWGVLEQFALGLGPEAEGVSGVRFAPPAHGRAEPDDPPTRLGPADARTADRWCAQLIELSVRTPLVVVVDDVQHADASSLACLGYLARRVRDARIIVVLAHGDAFGSPSPDFLLDAQRQPYCRTLTLKPLSQAGVAAMLSARLGDARFAEDCYRASGGNPLLVGGLVDDARAGAPQLTIGDGYTRAVLAALRRGGSRTLAAAQGIAVLDGPDALDRLLALDAETAAASIADLRRAGLLDRGRLRHRAARSAVLADMEPGLRADLHHRAAELGHADGLPATAIAEHLRAARRATTPWAVATLAEAARSALADGHVTAAIDYLRLACDACADESARAKLKTTLVRAQWRMNPAASMPRLAELIDTMRAGHLDGSDAVVLVKALLWHGRTEDAATVLTLLADSQSLSDPETVSELRTTRPWLRFSFAPLLDFVPPAAAGPSEPIPVGTAEGRRRFDAATVLDTVLTKGPSEQVVEEAERILRNTRLEGMGMDTVEAALLALTYAESPQRAAPWCDRLMTEAVAREAPGRLARLAAIRSEICVRSGDLLGAEGHARTSLEVIPAAGWGVALGGCLGSLLTALTAMGRHDEAAQALNLPVPDAMLQSRFGLPYLRARGRHSLAGEDPDGALSDFMYCGELMDRWSLDSSGLIAWRNDAAEAWLLMGEKDRARPLLEEQLARADRRVSPQTHGYALRLLAECYELRQRPSLLRHAADALQESGDRYGLALALGDLTAAFVELGETRRARVIGRQAWTVASECHAEPLCRSLAAHSGEAGGELFAGVAVLSEAEQRVADLVALGLTNREISQRLYITVSTVEQHLTRAYRKLGVTGRADLAVALSAGVSGFPVGIG